MDPGDQVRGHQVGVIWGTPLRSITFRFTNPANHRVRSGSKAEKLGLSIVIRYPAESGLPSVASRRQLCAISGLMHSNKPRLYRSPRWLGLRHHATPGLAAGKTTRKTEPRG